MFSWSKFVAVNGNAIPDILIAKFSTTSCLLASRMRGKMRSLPKVLPKHFQPEPDFTTPKEAPKRSIKWTESVLPTNMSEMRFKFPEFLPPDDPEFRHPLMNKLEREDMLKRRQVLDVPEFYVGSILAVTVSDPDAPGKVSRFVGICIAREGQGLRHNFTVRNIVENEGVEIRYDLYNPTIRSVEVLKLEKRLDDELYYLRDADPEFSTFDFNMDAEVRNPEDPVPVNPLKVRMKPYPWTKHWEVIFPHIRGIEKLENVPEWLYVRSRRSHNKYEKYDLMLEYRTHIPEESQVEIWQDVKQHEDDFSEQRKLEKRKKLLQKKE
ncbi:39S ribosomal protein L19, mitochondrial [Halotydeus destructor]|nr:39S ribosomal protein L19, mitochondrial [Halotydeus destructor]